MAVGSEELLLNHLFPMDMMLIQGRPILHIVYMATHFCATTFLRNHSTSVVWKVLQDMRSLVFVGPPDHICVAQELNFISKEMRSNLDACGDCIEVAPIENPGTMGMFERYQALLKAVYKRIRSDFSKETSYKECLIIAVYCFQRKDRARRTFSYVVRVWISPYTGQNNTITQSTREMTRNRKGEEKFGEGAGKKEDLIRS